MQFSEKLENIIEKFNFIEAKLNLPLNESEIAHFSRQYSELRPVVDKILIFRKLKNEIKDAEALRNDPDLGSLAEEELIKLKENLKKSENELLLSLIPKDETDNRDVMLEIRAGTGGDEAALFAEALLKMYLKYAERQGWKYEIIERALTSLGGIKEVVVNISGKQVFECLKFESGVHRVQRVPETESGGRIHTSAATVAVLPVVESKEINIDPSDIRIDTMRASGAGGQHVNTTDSAVRITHIPSGIVVTSSEKSQHQNRAKAMEVLKTKLFDLQRSEAENAVSSERKYQVGSGDRSERIRTYNFPQGRITEHRVNLSLYKLDQVLEGYLDEIINALRTADQAKKLAELSYESN